MCLEIPEDVDFETEELENTDVVREIVKCLGSFKTPSSQLELYRGRKSETEFGALSDTQMLVSIPIERKLAYFAGIKDKTNLPSDNHTFPIQLSHLTSDVMHTEKTAADVRLGDGAEK
ncbi:hypothetical protein RUM44_011121 [Polyplax serrata]|uniref:Uncharacterized protein n=1 Tax=Polyplax serrata TaxID=468196 RepID=A0ABR1AP47_POLSC